MKWFGPKLGLAVAHEWESLATPIGVPCARCGEPFMEGDSGAANDDGTLPMHTACWFRGLVGSVGHQRGRCRCYGGTEEDPEHLTLREAAEAAWNYYREINLDG